MAILKLEKRKHFNDSNMRKIINILVGLMSSVDETASQCLTDYDDTGRVYQRGNITIYDGYIWEALTVTQGVFDSSKWTKIGTDDFTELSIDDIKAMLGLTQDQIDYLAKLISDDTIVLDHTWSSSKSYTEIQQALNQAKQYCLTQLAKKSTGSFKIASSTAEVTDGNYLYLIMNPTTSKYDIFALISGNVEKLTTVDVNLDNYLTKTEIEADYLKKTDADGKYATITTVDGKVDKTDIATTISSTPSDEKVASEKAVYDKNTINHKTIQDIDILNYASKVVDNFEFVRGFNVINSPYNDSASPNNDMLYMINRIAVSGYCRLIAYDLRSTFAYMRTQLDGTWTDWVRITIAGGTEDYQTIATPQIKDGAFMSNSILWGTDRDFLVFDINKPDRTVRRIQFDTVEKAIGMYDLDYSTDKIEEVGTLRFQKTSYMPWTEITTFTSAVNSGSVKYCVNNGIFRMIGRIRVTKTEVHQLTILFEMPSIITSENGLGLCKMSAMGGTLMARVDYNRNVGVPYIVELTTGERTSVTDQWLDIDFMTVL